jgi:hypothetical protein
VSQSVEKGFKAKVAGVIKDSTTLQETKGEISDILEEQRAT